MTPRFVNILAVSDAVLDYEYLKILRIIKPYITCIMNRRYIDLIRSWLERLNDSDYVGDKVQRNIYLIQLGKQIEFGSLDEPFTKPPPKGPLQPYQEVWNELYFDEPDPGQDCETTYKEDTVLWRYFPFTKSSINEGNEYFSKTSARGEIRNKTCTESNDIHAQMFNSLQMNSSAGVAMQTKNELTNLDGMLRNVKQCDIHAKLDNFERNVTHLQNLSGSTQKVDINLTRPKNNSNTFVADHPELFRLDLSENVCTNADGSFCEKVCDTSSWQDVSTAHSCDKGLPSGDAGRDRLRDKSVETGLIEKNNDHLRGENEDLKRKLKFSEEGKCKSYESIRNLMEEIANLKAQLKELAERNASIDIKDHIKCQTTTIDPNKEKRFKKRECLESKVLTGTFDNQKKNAKTAKEELVSLQTTTNKSNKIQELENQLHELTFEKDAEIRRINDQLEKEMIAKCQSCEKELSMLRKQRTDLEQKFRTEINYLKISYEERILKIRDGYEESIKNMKNEYIRNIDMKDTEIERLDLLIQQQCMRMKDEVQQIRQQLQEADFGENEKIYKEKIVFLQSCILKMEKLFVVSEKEHHRQLGKLRKMFKQREKHNQVQHCAKNAYLQSTVNNLYKISDVELLIQNLDSCYKNILLKHQRQQHEVEKNGVVENTTKNCYN